MKKFSLRNCSNLLAFTIIASLCLTGLVENAQALSFTISPTAVSNTFHGPITLQVNGLANGDTAVVQKFLDLNTNGVIDPTDLLVQQFSLTDGQAGMVIGGVTNINVPGDLDSTAGQIKAKLHFPNGDFVQAFAGQYLFKVSTPAGALTNSFTVTNLPYAQEFTGSVVNNGTNVPNALVILFPPPRSGDHGPGNPVASVVADNQGNYTVSAPVGNYMPVAFGGNFISDASTAPLLTLTNNTIFTTNLSLVNATASISGQVVDANNPSVGLPGLFVPATTKNGLIAFCFSDTNGNFTARVATGTWGFEGEPPGLTIHGYVGYQNGTNVSDGSNLIGAFYKGTALFYGRVTDSSGNPMPGIDITASENNGDNGEFQADGFSDTNGDYAVCALGGLSGDSWMVQADNGSGSSNPANYIFSQPDFDQNGGTNLNIGQVVPVDITALIATNYITGNVQHDGTNVPGVGVTAVATINGADYNVSADTDANGNYSLNVANGFWSVNVNCNGGNDSLDTLIGAGAYVCPGNEVTNIHNANATVNFTVLPCGAIQIVNPITTNLPAGTVSNYYYFQFNASSCNDNFNWSVPDPQHLPPGLTMYSGGVINGTPTTNGIFNFTVHVSDNSSAATNQIFSVTINPPPVPPVLGQAAKSNSQFQFLVSGSTGQNYTVQVSTNLNSTNWNSLLVTNSSVTPFEVTDPNATNPMRFYRILLGP